MKSILISIQPKWCELIASGKKTIEVRKTAPKEVPFKAYIYATKPKSRTHPARIYNSYIMPESGKCGSGKVIGEFICDRVICCQAYYGNSGDKHLTNLFGFEVKQTCLTEEELFNYIVGNKKEGTGWLWHISDLKIYDEPRELGEFFTPCPTKEKGDCLSCDYLADNDYGGVCTNNLTRPPQSWQYVEEI